MLMPRGGRWWRLAASFLLLTVGIAVAIAFNWWIAAAVVGLGLLVMQFPMRLYAAMLLLVSAATFVNNEGGHMTRDLSIVTLLAAYALLCLMASSAARVWAMPLSRLTIATLLLAATTALSFVHGVLGHYSMRYAGLELIALAAVCSSWIVGGLHIEPRQLRTAYWLFVPVALSHVGLGFYAYAVYHIRTGGIYFTPVPGMVALIFLNLLLHDPTPRWKLLRIFLLGLFLTHTMISFARGYWLGLLVGIPLSCVLYVRRGPGTRERLARTGGVFAPLLVFVALGAVVFGIWFGFGDMATLLNTRLFSSFGIQHTSETASNIERLVEYRAAWLAVLSSPMIGRGLGYEVVIRQPFYLVTTSQWFIHEMYIWILLKQGIIGLIALLAVLWAALRLSVSNAMRLEGEAAGWSAGVAACTLYLAIIGLTHYPFAQVNCSLLMAFLWGIMLSLSRPARLWFTWRGSVAAPLPHAG